MWVKLNCKISWHQKIPVHHGDSNMLHVTYSNSLHLFQEHDSLEPPRSDLSVSQRLKTSRQDKARKELAAASRLMLASTQHHALPWLGVALLDAVPSFLDVHLPVFKHPVNVSSYREKHLLNILARPRRRLEKAQPVEVGKVFALLCAHRSQGVHVGLVPDDHVDGFLRLNVQLSLLEPLLEMLKALAFGDVIDEQYTNRVTIVGFRY